MRVLCLCVDGNNKEAEMKVEAGKIYISKGGFFVGPMKIVFPTEGTKEKDVAFFTGKYRLDGSVLDANWTENGRFCGRVFYQIGDDDGPCTLVKEYIDEPPLTA